MADTMQKPVALRELRESDRDQVEELWQRFGTPENIDDWVNAAVEDTPHVFGVVACHGLDVVGVGLLGYYSPEEIADYLSYSPDVEVPDPSPILHLGVVDSKYENRGIGTRLMKARVNKAAKDGARYIWGVSWRRDSGKDSTPLFRKCGFEEARHIKDYYQGNRGYCPDCGKECTCPATVFRREL